MNKTIKYIALILCFVLVLGAFVHLSMIASSISEPVKGESNVNLFDEQKIMGVTGSSSSPNPYWGSVMDDYLLAERAYYGGANMWFGYSMELKPGKYVIFADVYVPTGNAPDTRIALGLRTDDNNDNSSDAVSNMYLDDFDTWQHVSVYITISERGTYYLVAQGFGSSGVYKDFGVRFKNIAIYKT